MVRDISKRAIRVSLIESVLVFKYLSHVLSVCSSVCFSPLDFTRVPLHLEVLVAFRPTEPKNLQKDNNKTCS